MMEVTLVGQPLRQLSDAEFVRHVNTALKQFHSVLALARSPLAHSELLTPLLVLDSVSPSADRRGGALRLLLRWAVGQLAPELPRYGLGEERPFSDPTWQDPRWWRYNILRHRYLEPLHPDDFVEGGRYTETLLALTGIPSPDIFFDERNRAVREVAQRLRQQLQDGHADAPLRQLALAEVYRPLRNHPAALALLDIAATFDGVFPRSLLLAMARQERLAGAEEGVRYLVNGRLFLTDEDDTLWLSPALQQYVYQQQLQTKLRQRHQQAAAAYAAQGETLAAATHWQKAGQWAQAAETVLAGAAELMNELELPELREALLRFKSQQLPKPVWREVQILLSDLYFRGGEYEAALVACRQALPVAEARGDQARIYRRMGKLYEKQNQLHALAYYQQAAERFAPDAAELVTLLKDRGWLYFLRREWAEAEADLQQAVALVADGLPAVRADIFDALASLKREQKQFAAAIAHAQAALALREEAGNLPRVADSFNNLGLLYTAMGAYGEALTAYAEALQTYQRLGNRERVTAALLNMGMAHHLNGRLPEAVALYRQSLPLCQQMQLAHIEAKAHYNLAEALAALNEGEAARHHWQAGYELSVAAQFADQIAYFGQLREETAVLQAADLPDAPPPTAVVVATPRLPEPVAALDPDEKLIVVLATEEGQVTAKRLTAVGSMSKATATRKLSGLVEKGVLEMRGQGRGTHYVLRLTQGDLLPLVTRLRGQLGSWGAQFGLTALGIVNDGGENGRLQLLASFSTLPDLAHFFMLETAVAEVAGQPVDVKPLLPGGVAVAVAWL